MRHTSEEQSDQQKGKEAPAPLQSDVGRAEPVHETAENQSGNMNA